jgi:hypothetical protein
MSKTDYSDAGIKFPRLQVRIFSDGEKQLVDTWLWKEAGGERLQIMKSQLAGSMDYAHRLIGEFKVKHGAECGPDDIDVENWSVFLTGFSENPINGPRPRRKPASTKSRQPRRSIIAADLIPDNLRYLTRALGFSGARSSPSQAGSRLLSVTGTTLAFPPSNGKERAMMIKRRRFKQETSHQDRIVEWAIALRKQADVMRPGAERDELLKKLRQAETAMHMEDWANSRGLQPPK